MLTPEQKAALAQVAEREGVDPQELVSAAERIVAADAGGGQKPAPATPGAEIGKSAPPKLFMYHLPFVTVKEVRQRWLGLTDSFAGDAAVASEWAADHGGSLSQGTGGGTETG